MDGYHKHGRYNFANWDCPVCIELKPLRQDKLDLLAAARWALDRLQSLDIHKNHRGIVSNSLNSHGLEIWDKHEAAIAKAGKES